jgi:ATP-dependent helicase/nuclease subunit A
MTLSDQRARERIRNDLDTTLVIEAAAGTGKTTELVNRIVAVVAAGRTRLSRIVAVTFTEKAAGELKLRLRSEIESARHDLALGASERDRLRAAVPELEEARIGTIHSFCADLLRERPVEARVDPMFEVAPEDVSGSLFDQAFERWFEQALAEPGDGMRRLLRRRELGEGEGPRAVARAAAEALAQWRDFDAPWDPSAFDRDREIDALVGEIEALGAIAADAGPDDYLARALGEISRPVAEATRLESVRGRDYDALEQVLTGLLRGNHNRRFGWRGFGETFGRRPRSEVLARREALRDRLVRFRDNAGANLAPMLRDELWPVVGYYQELKRRAGVLDFLDLLLVARDLVRDNAAVRAELQGRFSHVFVDEFQDTDPLQAEILMLLCADSPDESDWTRVRPAAGKLFIVGDPKQSIYRFRRADVSLYQDLKRRLREHGAAIEHLTVSFRATPELQEMVNAAVGPLMPSESDTQPAYVALERFRQSVDTQPSVVVLPVPAPYGDFGKVVEWKIEQSLPDAVAAYVKWLVTDSGWTVTERDHPERRVALSPRRICILFRRLNAFGRDVTRPYVRALEARHIPHVLVKGGSFNEREEIEAARNLLGAIERPDDELLVFAALRGPVFAFSDAALLEFRETIGSIHPFRRIPADATPHLQEIGRALGLLRELNRSRNRRPIADTLARLLAATRAHAGFAIWPTGEQALANVMRLGDMARRYEARGGGATSFRGFVDELEARAEREQASEVPVVEEGAEGVRIMTVHRAKGLEFPVVILADITCKDIAPEPARFISPPRRLCAQRLAGCAPRELAENAQDEARRDREEAARLLYVAATRARDLLVVPAVGDDGFNSNSADTGGGAARQGWLAGLDGAIFPEVDDRRRPLTASPAGCPEFGDDSVRVRPKAEPANGKKAAPPKERSVAPGLHRARAGTHRVVWWDPAKLELDVAETMGLRQMQLLKADAAKTVSRSGIEAWERWRDGIEAMLEKGSAPQFIVKTATELAAEKDGAAVDGEDAIEIVEAARDAARPHGQRFGALVHLVMLRVGLKATPAEVLAVAAGAGRMLGADSAEIEAAARAVTRALESPLMERVRESADVRRECPVVFAPGDGPAIVEGVVDVAFLERGERAPVWTVVDFKTDLELSGRIAEYRRQVALYVRGIAAATGMAARGILFWI